MSGTSNTFAKEIAAAVQAAPIVKMTNVSKWFRDSRNGSRFHALTKFNLVIDQKEAGAFLVLLGPSGCGKSTILSLISGLALADEGEISVFGKVVRGPDRNSATVQQAYTCFPWLTILQNVEFGLRIRGNMNKSERRDRARRYLDLVGLSDRADAYPKQLSGGMQQRVAIARTLAIRPRIMLMDEPFGALDAQTRTVMQQILLRLWEQERNTIIFVTHDITEALLLGDRVIVFSPCPARVIHEETNLDAVFGHKREPSVMHNKEFAERWRLLRDKLNNAPTDDPNSIPAEEKAESQKDDPAAVFVEKDGAESVNTSSPPEEDMERKLSAQVHEASLATVNEESD